MRPARATGCAVPRDCTSRVSLYESHKHTDFSSYTSAEKQLGISLTKMYWLLRRKSKLSTSNKLLIYKTILEPIWAYGTQLWGPASTSNIEILERFQSKALLMIVMRMSLLRATWHSFREPHVLVPSRSNSVDKRVTGYKSCDSLVA
jgi:hypothetical protein